MRTRIGTAPGLLIGLVLVFFLMMTGSGLAAGIASFRVVTGSVDLLRGGKLPAVPARVGDPLAAGDFVRTKSGGYAEVAFNDGTLLKIAQRSRVDIGEQFSGQKGNGANVRLPRGTVQTVVNPATVKQGGPGRRFEVHTPNAVAGVRGTVFTVTHDRRVTGIVVQQGSVYTYNPRLPDRIVTVPAGTVTTVAATAPPLPPRQALPAELNRMEKELSTPKPEKSASGQEGAASGQGASQSTGTPGEASRTTAAAAPSTTTATPTTTSAAPAIDTSLPVITVMPTTLPPTAPAAAPLPQITTITTAPPPPPPPPPPVPVSTHSNVNVRVNFP